VAGESTRSSAAATSTAALLANTLQRSGINASLEAHGAGHSQCR
jgi:hypothetical protein